MFVISSFSKYFNMTGWRLGWVIAPERHVRDLEKLAQNLYISPPTLSQHAALACFEPATIDILEARRDEFRARRDLLVPALRELGFGIPVMPTGGFFVYADTSRLAADSRAFCRAALACFEPATIDILESRRDEFRARRDLLVPALRELGFGIPVMPTGGFFVYADTSKLADDSRAFCRDVLEHAGVAITPGLDFGTHRASEHVRFAYTIARAKIEDGIARLARHLGKTHR